MIRLSAIALLMLAAPGHAVPGGTIDSLDAGDYVCELPGDATGSAGLRQDAQSFAIINANSYRSATGRGAYLLTGDLLVMTSGPKRGERYHRLTDRFLRQIGPDGNDSALRCVRRVVNNR